MENIRSFIAIELNKEIKEELVLLIDKLKSSGADVKWVKAENIHLTLKFLGYVSEEKINEVKKILGYLQNKFKTFQMTFSGIGAFPKPSYPKVVWVGIDKGKDDAKEIYDFLEIELEKIGFQREERPFSPHLTIGRVKSFKNKESLKTSIESLRFSSKNQIEVNHITLFQSTLTPKGPVYTSLYEAGFSV